MGGAAVPTICELGPLAVHQNGETTPVRGRRSASVLALLAADRRRVRTIDELVEAGWSGPGRPATARQSLANVLSRLRRTHGESFIESTGHGYRLGAEVGSDRELLLQRLSDAIDRIQTAPSEALALVDQALAVWRGAPWADLDDIDELRIDRSRLIQAHFRLRFLRADALLALGHHDESIDVFMELVGEDPTNEAAWNGWAEALRSSEQRVQALRVVDRARSTLAESGLLLGSALLETEQRLLDVSEHDAPATVVTATSARDLPLALAERPSVLIGRDAELDALSAEWKRCLTAGRVRVVVGEAGVGKTTLAAEFAHRVAATGAAVLHGAADDVLNLPYQPYAVAARDWSERSAVRLDVDEGDRSLLASVLGAGDDERATPPPFRVLDAFHRALSRLADSGPVLLVLEDLHWATPETVLLTRSLSRRVPRGVLLLVLARPAATLDPLLDDARRVRSMGLATLGELAAQNVAELIRAVAPDSELDPSVVVELAGGNPLLVTEFATAGSDSRQWSLAGGQLASLRSDVRRLLELGAILGEVFWAEDLAEAAGRSLEDTLTALYTAADQRLVSMTDGRTWQFRHALVRDAVLRDLTERYLARLHLRVAESLAAQRRPRAAEVAQHYVAAGSGGRRQAVNWLTRAAEDSHRAGAHEQAAQYWAQVIELDREADARGLIATHMAHGTALVRAGYWERSHESFEAAAANAAEISDVAAHADAAIAWVQAPENHATTTRFPSFILATRDFLDELDPGRRACLAGILSIDAMDNNRFEESADLIGQARIEAAGLDDVETRAFVERCRLRTWWDPDQIEQRYQAALDLAAIGRRHNEMGVVCFALRWQIIHGIESGRLSTVMYLCRQLIKLGRQRGEPFHVWLGWSRLALVNLAFGSIDDSLRCLGLARDLAEILGTSYVQSSQAAVHAWIEFQLGPAASDVGRSEQPLLGLITALAEGRLEDISAELDTLDPPSLIDFDHFFGEMPGRLFWTPLAFAAAAIGSVRHASVLLSLLEPASEAFAVHTPGASFTGAIGLNVAILRRVLGDLDGAVNDLERAIARNDQVDAVVPSAVCRLLLADVLDQRARTSDGATARAVRASARSIAPQFDASASPVVRALTHAAR